MLTEALDELAGKVLGKDFPDRFVYNIATTNFQRQLAEVEGQADDDEMSGDARIAARAERRQARRVENEERKLDNDLNAMTDDSDGEEAGDDQPYLESSDSDDSDGPRSGRRNGGKAGGKGDVKKRRQG